MMPLPCLPVDSASNCSSHAPRSEIPGEAMIVTLSRPLRGRRAQNHASNTPGILFDGNAGAARLDHLLCAVEKAGDIHAHQRRRNHAEIRQRRITPADTGHAGENMAEVIGLGHLLHFRAGIGDGDEVAARFVRAHALHPLKEILLEDLGSSVVPDLLETINKVLARLTLFRRS